MAHSTRTPDRLPDGEYVARCKEPTVLAAALNGHGPVWPGAQLIVSDGWAMFYRDENEVWSCNATYAASHFHVTSVPLGH